MEKGKDIRTTLRLRKTELVQPLETQVREAMRKFESTCESIAPERHASVIVLMDPQEPLFKLIGEAFEGQYDVCYVSDSFDLFKEIARNSIVAIILQVDLIREVDAAISCLSRRGYRVLPVYHDANADLKAWQNAFGEAYKWPDEVGRVLLTIKNLS